MPNQEVMVAVDLVVLAVIENQFRVLLVRRGIEPHLDRWALPGGFLLSGEPLLRAAERELAEETGLRADRAHFEQLATYGAPDRDPRGRVVSVTYLVFAPLPGTPTGGSDAAEARWWPVNDVLDGSPSLAFDHHGILDAGVERARSKLEYTPLAAAFCPPEFTVVELRRVYEAVWNTTIDPRNFHRKVTGTDGFVVPTGDSTNRGGGRPARLYRTGEVAILQPAMLRPT